MFTFSLFTGLGATLGVWQVARNAPPRETSRWVDAALLTLGLALIGARVVYVLLEWPYYAQQPQEIFQIWLGGLAWPGAALGWLVGALLAARLWRAPLGLTLDYLSLLLAPLAVGVWLGCWQAGCAYGTALPAGDWRGIPTPDESGVTALRLPLQPLMALTTLVFEGLISAYLRPLQGSGIKAGFSVMGLTLVIFVASLAWVQPTRQVNGLALDGWLALFFSALGLVWIISASIYRKLSQRNKTAHE